MSVQGSESSFDWSSITFARARQLTLLADGRTEREIGERLQITYASVRSLVEDLKGITGQGSVREIGRWWRENRKAWLAWCGEQAGLPKDEGYAS